MYTSAWKALASDYKGSRCQLEKALLLVQRDRRNVYRGEPVARHQQHVLDSPHLPCDNVRGLGWEYIVGLRPWRGGRHRQGIILAKP